MSVDLGILLVRVLFGLSIAAHGAQKLFGLFGGHGLKGTGGFFQTLGFKPGVAFAAIDGIGELGGGLLLALGLFTPVGAATVLAAMIVAILSVHAKNGFFAANNGIELPFVFAAAALGVVFTGGGTYSLDALFGLDPTGDVRLAGGLLALAVIVAGLALAMRRQDQPQAALRRSKTNRRIKLAALFVALLGVAAYLVLAWRPSIAQIEPPGRAAFSPQSIARGEVLAAEGHCASCHTGPGEETFAGGYGVNTPFGVIYGTNITPDPDTGIGRWSLKAFTRAMHEGIARDGSHLYPAFPYWAYTKLTDDDVKDLYAYLMTRPPVHMPARANALPLAFKVRAVNAGWNLLFFKSGRFEPKAAKSEQWNRGAYLADSLSDCSGCHTPRSALGGEESGRAYAGTVIDGWTAPPLTSANPSPVPWTEADLFDYLRNGVSRLHGATDATMTQVIRGGLALPVVPDSDVRAIAFYFSDINGASANRSSAQAVEKHALATSAVVRGEEYDPDAQLYASACMSCHYNAGSVSSARPELALSSALTLPEPTNFIQVVLRGVGSEDGAPGMVMPAYASSHSDAEIARLAAYLRRTRTTLPPWNDLEKKVAAIRRSLPASQ